MHQISTFLSYTETVFQELFSRLEVTKSLFSVWKPAMI